MSEPSAQAQLQAFLTVHARGAPLPAALYAKGETLWRELRETPPTSSDWGRFLVALGELAAEHLHDQRAAYGHFQAALASVAVHGDSEVGTAAAYNLGVLLERRQDFARARQAYAIAGASAARAGSWSTSTLRCAEGAARLAIHVDDALHADEAALLKQAWLAWFSGVEGLDPDLDDRLLRTLAAVLLPEEDPATLFSVWRNWPPDRIDDDRRDDDPRCLLALARAAVRAAERHLCDEPGDAAGPYRVLCAALERQVSVKPS
jgi:hypothetical protein